MRPERTGVGQDKKIRGNRSRQKNQRRSRGPIWPRAHGLVRGPSPHPPRPPPPPPSQISSHPARYTFLSLNARSLFNKIEELSEVTEKLKPLFICVQETWCVHGKSDSFYHIDGFSLFCRDRVDRIGGGVCIYVNTSQAHTIEQIQLDNDIEAIWLTKLLKTSQSR